MKVIGLTGGIASGKSTAARVLFDDGVTVIDADELSRAVTAPDTQGLRAIRDAFGDVFLTRDGHLDRRRLGNFVFVNEDARRKLESIVHPRVKALAEHRIKQCRDAGVLAVVYEAALLFEMEAEKQVDASILIAAPVEMQRARIMDRDGFTAIEADRRISTQMSLDDKRKRATIVIENTGSRAELAQSIRHAWGRLVGGLA